MDFPEGKGEPEVDGGSEGCDNARRIPCLRDGALFERVDQRRGAGEREDHAWVINLLQALEFGGFGLDVGRKEEDEEDDDKMRKKTMLKISICLRPKMPRRQAKERAKDSVKSTIKRR